MKPKPITTENEVKNLQKQVRDLNYRLQECERMLQLERIQHAEAKAWKHGAEFALKAAASMGRSGPTDMVTGLPHVGWAVAR